VSIDGFWYYKCWIFRFRSNGQLVSQLNSHTEVNKFSRNLEATSKFYAPEVPQWGQTNIRHHGTNFSQLGRMAPAICAPLHSICSTLIATKHGTECMKSWHNISQSSAPSPCFTTICFTTSCFSANLHYCLTFRHLASSI